MKKNKYKIGDMFITSYGGVRGILCEHVQKLHLICWTHPNQVILNSSYTTFEINTQIRYGNWYYHPVIE